MKKRILLLTFLFATLAFTFMSNSNGRATTGNADSTGAGTNGVFCQQCHSSGNFAPNITIQVFTENTTNAVTEYIAGTVYDVKVTVAATTGTPSGFGTQFTCLKASNSTAITGFSSPSSNAKLATLSNGRQFVEQNGLSASGVFTAKWTAPASSTGSVTFFAAGIAADGSGNTANDGATKTTLTLTEAFNASSKSEQQLAVSLKVYPNPVETILNIETIGSISGEHTLTITNLAGQVILNQQVDMDFGMDFTQVNVAHLAKGIYNLTLAKDGKVATTKMVKQ
jgi:hypothetical protein